MMTRHSPIAQCQRDQTVVVSFELHARHAQVAGRWRVARQGDALARRGRSIEIEILHARRRRETAVHLPEAQGERRRGAAAKRDAVLHRQVCPVEVAHDGEGVRVDDPREAIARRTRVEAEAGVVGLARQTDVVAVRPAGFVIARCVAHERSSVGLAAEPQPAENRVGIDVVEVVVGLVGGAREMKSRPVGAAKRREGDEVERAIVLKDDNDSRTNACESRSDVREYPSAPSAHP